MSSMDLESIRSACRSVEGGVFSLPDFEDMQVTRNPIRVVGEIPLAVLLLPLRKEQHDTFRNGPAKVHGPLRAFVRLPGRAIVTRDERRDSRGAKGDRKVLQRLLRRACELRKRESD